MQFFGNKNAKKKKREELPESSIGMRVTALGMTVLLLLASATYVPTSPLLIFFFLVTAAGGSYLAYLYRDSRPIWLGSLPTVGTILLFTNFAFEVYVGFSSGASSAVPSFIHLLAGLNALHCFDLRTRTDFSISALIGLGLLTALTGLGKDYLFAFYIFMYTVMAGLLLFFDSSSRSHELGPSRAIQDLTSTQRVKSLAPAAFTTYLPIAFLPMVAFCTFLALPHTDSLFDMFIDNVVRAKFPLSAIMGGQLAKGGRSQSVRGGSAPEPATSGASYTAKGGEHGTASGAGKGNNKEGEGNAAPGPREDLDLEKLKKLKGRDLTQLQKRVAEEQKRNEEYDKETIDLNYHSASGDEIVLKVASPQASYVRLFALNGYNGCYWKRIMPPFGKNILPDKALGFDLTSSDSVYIPPSLPTLEVKQEFRLEKNFGSILPVSWIPQLVNMKATEMRIDADATVKTTVPLTRGFIYTCVSQLPVYDFDTMRRQQLETLTEVDEDRKEELDTAKSCVALTAEITPRIKALGAKLGSSTDNWFVRGEKICEYLRKNYRYDNSTLSKENTKDEEPYRAVEKFLFETKTGNCRHFATAHAILCRSQGIPARVVVGYAPGVLNKNTGYTEIRARDLHLWSEVYMPYWNWIPFDPTPGANLPYHEEGGNPLQRFIASGLANPFAQQFKSNKTPRQSKAYSLDKGSGVLPPPPPLPQAPAAKFNMPMLGQVDQELMANIAKILAVMLLAGALGSVMYVYLKQRESRKEMEYLGSHKPSTVVYLEVLGDLKRYELIKSPTETADEMSIRIKERFDDLSASAPVPSELPAVVTSFMDLYNEGRFGGADNLDELTQLGQKIKQLTSEGRSRRN